MSGRAGVLVKALLVCGAVLALDQLGKALVRGNIERGKTVELLPFLDLANTRNRGIAFGLAGEVPPLVTAVAIGFLVGLLVFLSLREHADPLVWLPAGLLVGGALGNLIDRVREGAVTDFIDFPYWPTFNFADMAITVGVVLLVLLPEISHRRERRAGKEPGAAPGGGGAGDGS
ncbi:MAG: signal peptidase II [Actinobacteria bacterium]|nr:signal peptidase II [Actinomycetota bacterium]